MFKTLSFHTLRLPVFVKNTGLAVKKSASLRFRLYLAVGLIFMNGFLFLSYIYGVNAFASEGYEIKSLRARASALGEENKKIRIKVSESGSMISIQNNFVLANFVPAETPEFLQINAEHFTLK